MSTMTRKPMINTGLKESERKSVAEGLAKVLADSYTLYLKTQNFHWNVRGNMFGELHRMFEEHYRELLEAVDLIAERIRALGYPAPASYSEFSKRTSIKEAIGVFSAEEMIRALVEGHETVVHTCRSAFQIAEHAGDQATMEMLTERMTSHEKTAWMLRSHLT